MGAVESTAISPPPLPQPPPADPDDEAWRQFFENYPHQLLSPPSFPAPGAQLHASATGLRAATFRLRAHIAALQSRSALPFAEGQIYGALHFARTIFSSVRNEQIEECVLAEALGSVDGAEELLRQDRIDIGMSVLWQIVTCTLDCIAWNVGGIAPMQVVILAVGGEGRGLWKVAGRYAHVDKVVIALLDAVSEIDVNLEDFLDVDTGNESGKTIPGVGRALGNMGVNWQGGLEALGGLAVRWREGRVMEVGDGEAYAHFAMEPISPGRKEREREKKVGECALGCLGVLCGREKSVFRKMLTSLEDGKYSFSRLYEMLGKWLPHDGGGLVGYYLLTENRKFRTFALARTDPDVLLLPLLAALRKRCGGGGGDVYLLVAILVVLTADKGFCAAIDMIQVGGDMMGWVEERGRLGGEKLSLSGAVLLVCARGVQQSLVMRRRRPECFVAEACVAVMANVARDVTNLHSMAAERLLSLVEFLVRRRGKAILVARHVAEMPAYPPRIGESPRKGSVNVKVGKFERSEEFVELLGEVLGIVLEVVISVLRSTSMVNANRHLVYCLMHREAVLDLKGVKEASVKCEALSHILKQVVGFFAKWIELENGGEVSVERVFEIIDQRARLLSQEVFEGVPEARFKFEGGEGFGELYAWNVAMKGLGGGKEERKEGKV